ncbi:hypothetical protein LTR70_006661 [Exophiala xenobiotica]|uniref:Uncharacterized protein n=1 Tax=Lithohypha guttulata TaxID=1690604 RepID=A0ABR0K7J2_9EURO|nr:hypothetical protein LTR24_006260 [Lithohypha guttulata]KAK5315577.1 hypothetical protein LTR70_006661 [Exophiala xenobiotica]
MPLNPEAPVFKLWWQHSSNLNPLAPVFKRWWEYSSNLCPVALGFFPSSVYSRSFSDLVRYSPANLEPSDNDNRRLRPSLQWSYAAYEAAYRARISKTNAIMAALCGPDVGFDLSGLDLGHEIDSGAADVAGRRRYRRAIASGQTQASSSRTRQTTLRARLPEQGSNIHRLPQELWDEILSNLSREFGFSSELVESYADLASVARAIPSIAGGITMEDEVGTANWDQELGTFCYVEYKKWPARALEWIQYPDTRPTWVFRSDLRGLPPPSNETVFGNLDRFRSPDPLPFT